MTSRSPRVSVAIPTYNRREMVLEAVASALAQTLADIEIIVVDDGSTNGTADALRAEFGNRIHVEVKTNQGESVARNRGIALAQAEYVAFLDSDVEGRGCVHVQESRLNDVETFSLLQ